MTTQDENPSRDLRFMWIFIYDKAQSQQAELLSFGKSCSVREVEMLRFVYL